MNIGGNVSKTTVSLLPGDYHVSRNEIVIRTILGSCVSVCLYDPLRNIVGMNHFLLSGTTHGRNKHFCPTEAGRYGTHAMELVINGMLQLGAKKEDLRAKAFGGASLLPVRSSRSGFATVGEINSRFVVEFLQDEMIPLVASDLGGYEGRAIRFYANDFSVVQRKIKKVADDLVKQEEQYWRSERRKTHPEPEIWIRAEKD